MSKHNQTLGNRLHSLMISVLQPKCSILIKLHIHCTSAINFPRTLQVVLFDFSSWNWRMMCSTVTRVLCFQNAACPGWMSAAVRVEGGVSTSQISRMSGSFPIVTNNVKFTQDTRNAKQGGFMYVSGSDASTLELNDF